MTEASRRVARGAGWLYGYRWSERALDLVSIIVLARLLVPEDFGLVAIAASIATIIEGLSPFDVEKALIQNRDPDPALYDTAWTLSALRGSASALVVLAIAALVVDGPIAPVLAVLATGPFLKGLANPRFVDFERDLVYSRLAVLTLGAKLAAFGMTLAIAVVRPSPWALVIGLVAGSVVTLVGSYALRPYRPRICFERFGSIFAFSGWMSLTTIVTTLSMDTDKIIIGRLLGTADTGLYFMTQRVGTLPTRELVGPLQRLLFPSFSQIAHEAERLGRVVRESINVLSSLSLPAAFGFALVANDLVPKALGADWTPIVPLLIILIPFLGIRGMLSMTLPCVMALGHTRLLFRVSLLYGLVHVPVFVIGTAIDGLRGSVVAIVSAGVLYVGLNGWMLQRVLGISPGDIVRAARAAVPGRHVHGRRGARAGLRRAPGPVHDRGVVDLARREDVGRCDGVSPGPVRPVDGGGAPGGRRAAAASAARSLTVEKPTVRALGPFGDRRPGVGPGHAPSPLGEGRPEGGVAENPLQRRGQRRGRARGNEQGVLAIPEKLRERAHPGGDDGDPERQRQVQDTGLADVPVGQHHGVRRREVAADVLERDVAEVVGWPRGPRPVAPARRGACGRAGPGPRPRADGPRAGPRGSGARRRGAGRAPCTPGCSRRRARRSRGARSPGPASPPADRRGRGPAQRSRTLHGG